MNPCLKLVCVLAIAALAGIVPGASAAAQGSLPIPPAWQPTGKLAVDAAGDVFGEAVGSNGFGGVYELVRDSSGYRAVAIYEFKGGADGQNPGGNLVLDGTGAIYGVTQGGYLPDMASTVFELKPASVGYAETVLYRFLGGNFPTKGLTTDGAGNLYGSTSPAAAGITCPLRSCGALYFELTPDRTGGHERTIFVAPANLDSGGPRAPVIADASGRLFGAAAGVFELYPTRKGYGAQLLDKFDSAQSGTTPLGSLDPSTTYSTSGATVFGTTLFGGSLAADGEPGGVVFEILSGKSGFTEKVLHRFLGGMDGEGPQAALITDRSGNLFTATRMGGETPCYLPDQVPEIHIGCGTVVRLVPTANAYAESVIYRFAGGRDGSFPQDLTLGPDGALYGTTLGEFDGGARTVFKLTLQRSGAYVKTILYRFGS